MQNVPRKVSLIAQTQQVLVEGITTGRWQHRFPGERRLCEQMQISRWTLRAALAILAKQKWIRIRQGRPCEILGKVRRRSSYLRSWRIAFLMPAPFSQIRPFVALMFDEIRARLQKLGGELDVYHSRKCYEPNCAQALTELVESNPHPCWVLSLSTRAMQEWFAQRGTPVIVGGALYEGVRLASINVDYRAIGLHAWGAIRARGHRRIALLCSNRGIAGMSAAGLEIEAGLRAGFTAERRSDCEPDVIYHNGDPAGVCRILDRLLDRPKPPTALFIGDSHTLLTTLLHLGQRRTQIPRDVSVVAAEDEPYYPQFVPAVSHYEWTLERFASQWSRLIQHALDNTLTPDHRVRIIPRFFLGQTLAQIR